jgi:RNA polymerase sigma-70 factor (sigma-E family)
MQLVTATVAPNRRETRLDDQPTRPATVVALADQHALGLTRFAYLISGDHGRAEDLVQDVFLSMYRKFGPTVPINAPVAYARRAIVNANISWNRHWFTKDMLTADLPERGQLDPDPVERDALWGLLTHLPARQRSVLVLRYYLGYSDPEIAQLLGCRRGTVRSLASRALADLRERLDSFSGTNDGATS